MQTVRNEARLIDISPAGFTSGITGIPDPKTQIKRLKISEFKSWSVCYGVISVLTGLLIYLKVGVTMETITATLFVLSLVGVMYSVYKIIKLTRQPAHFETKSFHELN